MGLIKFVILLAESTIEARIVQLQNRKQFVAQEVVISSDADTSVAKESLWTSIAATQSSTHAHKALVASDEVYMF